MPAETIVTELLNLIQGELSGSAGEDLSSKEREGRTVVTLAGTHGIRRRKHVCCSCGRWSVPRDVSLGIGRGNYSVGVIALTSEVAAGFPFESAEDFLARRFSLDLCYKQVQRLAERTGEVLAYQEKSVADDAVAQRVQIISDERPPLLVISSDGLMVNVDGGWHEMKTGSIMSEYGRSTIATMERAEGFGQLLFAEASRRGLEEADEVVFLADGAAWIWNLAAHHFPDAVEIVDWYHAIQHLWEIANAWHGDGSGRAKSWVRRNETRLMEDGVERVIASIKQWQPTDAENQRIKRENLHYFSTNSKRMHYTTFKSRGYPIGSGSVESTCKQYGQGRLKQPGMRWKEAGIEAIAFLRSAMLNRRTEDILQAARKAA
jgi:hypothetical protein